MPELPDPSQRFQILSLDGGGVKGLFVAAFLEQIEQQLPDGRRIAEHFDLIAGTSTGGLIALGLASGKTASEVCEFYEKYGLKIFKPSRRSRRPKLFALRRTRFEAAAIDSALKECFGNERFGECITRVVVPSYNLSEDDVYVFRTAHLAKLEYDYLLPIWQIGRATAAAPTYLPACQEVGENRLIDGGVWANNPVMVAIAEANGELGVPLENIYVASFGTSDAVKERGKNLDAGGLLDWASEGIEIVMRGQSLGARNQANFLLGKDHVFRIDPKVPDKRFSLDDIAAMPDLRASGHSVARKFGRKFREKFLNHQAAPFEPFHQLS